MSEATETLLDLEDLMEASLDNIPEAPEFTNPPDGIYRLGVKEVKTDKYKTKKDPDTQKQRIKAIISVVNTIETKELPVPDGSMFSLTWQPTEQGLGFFKTFAKKVMDVSDMTGVPLKDIYTALIGTEFKARVQNKKTKDVNTGIEYENVNVFVMPQD